MDNVDHGYKQESSVKVVRVMPCFKENQASFASVLKIAGVAFAILVLAVTSGAQNYTLNPANSTPPVALTPGAPAGSYNLSGFESINVHNGRVSISLPVREVRGRGETGYTMTLAISPKPWSVDVEAAYGPPNETGSVDYTYTTGARPPSMFDPMEVGYGPGNVFLKRAAEGPVFCQVGDPARFTTTFTYVVFQAPDGTEHGLYDSKGLISANCATFGTTDYSRGDKYVSPSDPRIRFVSRDGSGMTFLPDTDALNLNQFTDVVSVSAGDSYPDTFTLINGWLMMRNGSRYRIGGGLVRWITDRNGNRTNFTYKQVPCPTGADPNAMCDSPYVETITDSIGRIISVQYDFNDPTVGVCDRITFKGAGGIERYLKVKKDVVGNLLLSGSPTDSPFPQILNGPLTDKVPGFLYLPDGRSYQFRYNIYGELARVVLPTGGAIEYDYQAGVDPNGLAGLFPSGQVLDKVVANGTVGPGQVAPPPPWRPFIYRRLKERRVYSVLTPSPVLESTTTSSRPERATNTFQCGNPPLVCDVALTNTGPVEEQVTGRNVTTAVVTKHKFLARSSYFWYGGVEEGTGWGPAIDLRLASMVSGVRDFPDPFEGQEYSTEDDAKTVFRVFRGVNIYPVTGAPTVKTEVCQELVTLKPMNQTAGRVFFHDQYANVKDEYDYDYGSAPPISTQTDPIGVVHYTCPATEPAGYARKSHTDYVTGPAYTADGIHLRHVPLTVAVYNPGAASPSSSTTYEYDIYTPDPPANNHAGLTDRPGISGHDTASFGTGYATRGNVTAVSRWLNTTGGSITNYQQYDIAGNVVLAKDARGNSTSFGYADKFGAPDNEAQNNSPPAELPSGQFSYGFVTTVANALNHTIFRQYDYYAGKEVNSQDANEVISSISYNDPLDRPTQVIRAVAKVNNPNLAEKTQTTFAYNDTTRIITTTSDRVVFNDTSNPLKSEVVYDGLGRQIETRRYESSSAYIATKQTYDGIGRPSQVSNPFRPGEAELWTTTEYDALGRVIRVTTPDGASVTTTYSGNQTTVCDQANPPKCRRSDTDALGRLTKVTEAPGVPNFSFDTLYAYDALDNLTDVCQGGSLPVTTCTAGQKRTFVYDSLSRLTSASNPESGTVAYEYDANGNLVKKTDARGIITCYGTLSGSPLQCSANGYDALNRVTQRSYSDGTPPNRLDRTPTVTYTYDETSEVPYSKGRLTKVTAIKTETLGILSRQTVVFYDALGRVTSSQQTTDGRGFAFSYTYDLAGNMTSQTYPSGRQLSFGYDSAGRVNSVTGTKTGEPAKTYTTVPASTGYAAHGAIKEMQLDNTLWEKTSFNNRLQPIDIQLGTSAQPASVLGLTFGYGTTNNNGNVLSQTITAPGLNLTQSYTYDALNRLETAGESSTGTVWSQSYAYDRYGNMWVSASSVPLQAATPAASTRFLPADGSVTKNRIEGNTYDPAGNQERAQGVLGGFTYDAENRQISATVDGIAPPYSPATYTYDGDGRRVQRVVAGIKRSYVYNTFGQMVAEYHNPQVVGSPPRKEFLHLGGKLLAMEEAAGASYITADHLGSTRVVTNQSGAVDSRHDYLPFGKEIPTDFGGRSSVAGYGAEQNLLQRFTGKEVDPETGLEYFGARYYSGRQGRFTSTDEPFADQHVVEPQSWNMYAYVRNNPLRYMDLEGQAVVDAGTVRLGRAAFKLYKRQANLDVAAMLATFWPVQHSRLNQFGNNQAPISYPSQLSWQDNQVGGCTLGCATTFTEQAIGITVNVSFNYDKNDNLTGANIRWALDPTAAFIGANPPPNVTTLSMMPGGLTPMPQVLGVNIDPNALKNLSGSQLKALAEAARKVPVEAVRLALEAATTREQKRRAEQEKQRKNCQSGQGDCPSSN